MTHQQAVATLASERYLLNDMTEFERHAFEAHFFACAACADDVRLGAQFRGGAKQAFTGRPPAARRPWRPTAVLPWAAAATLAVALGYTSLNLVPALRSANAPQVVTPVTLRPASRGHGPLVARGAGPLVLAIDISAPASGHELAYRLEGPHGNIVGSGHAAAPAAGVPLFILLPSGSVEESGEDILHVSDATRPDLTVGDYRFSVR